MNRDTTHTDYDLIAKCLAGEATGADEQALESWLQASEGNRAEYETLRQLWGAAEETVAAVDTDTAWTRVNALCEEETQVIRIDTAENPGRRWMSWAAMLAIMATIGAGIWYANLGSAPEMLVFATGDQPAGVDLPDGSKVTLRENSSLEYPASFDGYDRDVTLNGVGYFDISADKDHPFTVHTGAGDVRVVGTEFEVDARTPSEQLVVEVAEGVVEVSDRKAQVKSSVKAGEVCTLNVPAAAIEVQESTDPGPFFWKDRTIRFRRTELGRVAKTLEELLHIRVEFENEALTGCELTATFKDEDAETIMEIIATTLGLEVVHTGNTFTISGEGC